MSKFTKDAPFEFEGVKIWTQDTLGYKTLAFTGDCAAEKVLSAMSAMYEAERDEWRWTNDDHTEARRGRWHTRSSRDGSWWGVYHDDFGNSLATESAGRLDQCCAYQYSAREALDQFLAWKSAQSQPSEPSAIGYVFRANTPRGHTYTHGGNGIWLEDTGVKFEWAEIRDEWTANGVLSPGVAS